MKVAIIGCGKIAVAHIQIIKKLFPKAKIVIYDINNNKAKVFAIKYHVHEVYSNLDDLFSSSNPDAVHILTPPSSHAALAEKAILADSHVLIEKPVTETVNDYIKLLNLAKEKNKVLCVDFSILGMPVVLKAKEIINSCKLGKLISVHCNFACSWPKNTIPYYNPSHWAYSLKGGILQNMADHPASLVIDAMDGIQEHNMFFCRRNVLPNDCPDLLHVALRNDDQIGSFTLSLGHGSTHRQAEYFLEGGIITVDMSRQLISIIRNRVPQNFIRKTLSGINLGWNFSMGSVSNVFKVMKGSLQKDPGIVNIIHNFYNAIKGEEGVIVHSRTIIEVVSLLEKIWSEMNS